MSCHSVHRAIDGWEGGPASTTSRSLCHRTQSSRARTVTRFTILGSCDQPPAMCESKSRRGHGLPTELLLFDPQSRFWTCEGVLLGGLSHERSALRIQFHSPRKGHQRVSQKHLTALLHDSSAGETWNGGSDRVAKPATIHSAERTRKPIG